ncbi:MAG TPA: ATP-binding protein [Mariprofundaceae bacterium]|nr:ATP-binding protein [Mariprofundaceae bacterium]
MTSVLLLALVVMSAAWLFASLRMRRRLTDCQQEIRQLREASGGLESKLATRGRRLDVLLSSVNEAVLRVDQHGRVLAANQWAMELFRLPANTPFPQSILFFYRNPQWRQAFVAALGRLPENSRLPDMHLRDRVLAPRLAQLGREQALLLCMDITEKYRLEQQRRTFIANLMHDLKTPLTSLLGYARSIESFGEDAELRNEAAKVIADEAKHVNHLLDSLLTLDQIEFAARDTEASCDAPEVVRRVCSLLEAQAKAKQIRLACEPADAMPPVQMDEESLERVATNLVENAIRYSGNGSEVRLRLSVKGGECILRVEDNGPGIPEVHLPRVTERFYRVDRARGRSSTGGHGLGLAIVKELLEVHGGDLVLANYPPHGLLAEARIPLRRLPVAKAV